MRGKIEIGKWIVVYKLIPPVRLDSNAQAGLPVALLTAAILYFTIVFLFYFSDTPSLYISLIAASNDCVSHGR